MLINTKSAKSAVFTSAKRLFFKMSLCFHPQYSSTMSYCWNLCAPERLFDQHFGEHLTGPQHPYTMYDNPLSFYFMRPARRAHSRQTDYLDTDFSEIENNDRHLIFCLNVSHFKPEEITVVAVDDNILVVKGQHEENQDEHRFIGRKFVCKYVLPKECNVNLVTSQLSRDDILIITAPKLAVEGQRERPIPITVALIDVINKKPIQNSK